MKQLIPALLAALCLLLASCGTSPAATLPMGTDETPVESEANPPARGRRPANRCRRKTPSPIC